MTTSQKAAWVAEFGLDLRRPPVFFRCIEELDALTNPAPQTHAMRRAFTELDLDGVLCLANAPTVYFKEVERADPSILRTFQRRVWNQGLAPVLVVVDASAVHIYSGLALPARSDAEVRDNGRWVDTLDRASQALEIRQIIIGIETGEFFRIHAASFDPKRRVDRRLLENLGAARRALAAITPSRTDPRIVDALLCRLVFTCYLVDRRIIDAAYFAGIGAPGAVRLLDLLEGRPASSARQLLYALFRQLQHDFNGDLFEIDLNEESGQITYRHIDVMRRFLSGEDLISGQLALGFWAYDFSVIPIEMISAIYEDFLKAGDDHEAQMTGTYYTPRFLAEVVLDTALDGLPSLLGRRFLDPACGSGIFLVGLFHRLAEEWRRRHPQASYDEHVDALLAILRAHLFGVDNNLTACRIAAFSLYVALLDQLAPPAIRRLQARGRWLPRLVGTRHGSKSARNGHTILHDDFATVDDMLPAEGFDLILGNPPWVSRGRQRRLSKTDSLPQPLLEWCTAKRLPVAQGQLAQGFIWKAPGHLRPGGRICFLLPHGVLFNHDSKALEIQRLWFEQYPPERIVNLSDLRFLLFEGAIKPAVIVRYLGVTPEQEVPERIEYFVPKTDIGVLRTELLVLAPEDRTELSRHDVLAALHKQKTPPWKERLWGTPRDWKFLRRLASMPRLGALVDQARDRKRLPEGQWKQWIGGQGFQPLGPSDGDIEEPRPPWPSGTRFIKADSPQIDLLLLEEDCPPVADRFGPLRRRPEFEEIFHKPHVIVTKGMRVAYANFDVVFQHAAQGIHGPAHDSSLLMFLAAYLRSPLAHYFLFHTVANWGAERPEVHLEELLQVPFPRPEQTGSPESARALVETVATKMRNAITSIPREFGRKEAIENLNLELWNCIVNYFGVGPSERLLIEDTVNIAMRSATPRPKTAHEIPALRSSTKNARAEYVDLLCKTLNSWASRGPSRVCGRTLISEPAGLGVVVLWRISKKTSLPEDVLGEKFVDADVASVLERATSKFAAHRGAVLLGRGVKVFVDDDLFIMKPLQGRFWTRTAALNDADEIIAAIVGSSTESTTVAPQRGSDAQKVRAS